MKKFKLNKRFFKRFDKLSKNLVVYRNLFVVFNDENLI